MSIDVTNKTRTRINLSLVKKTTQKFLEYYKKKNYEVSIVFVGDKKMREINHIYRGFDKTTDVLSFAGEGNFLGEILINYQQIKRQAKQGVRQELLFILVHGLLHLLGYNDETEPDRLRMMEMGEKFIQLKIKN